MYLDLTPKGRNEGERGNMGSWARPHDQYDAGGTVDPMGGYSAPATATERKCH